MTTQIDDSAISGATGEPQAPKDKKKNIKCIVWDLDNTLWDGVLLEDARVTLREDVAQAIRVLDARGILHSIASRNDPAVAMAKLREFGIDEYFLYPQIHWDSKSQSIAAIARSLNFGIDAIAFVDDQPFERDEVRFAHPEVRCIDAADAASIPSLPEMNPRFITDDSRVRRKMYQADIERKTVEESHRGSLDEFLASLGMHFVIAPAQEDDLKRAEELTVRTNQLNATGYTYSYDELSAFRTSPHHDLLIAGLEDKYGTYGKIGLALVERSGRIAGAPASPTSPEPEVWTLKLLLMSCRVMSRGVGTVLLNHILRRAQKAGARLRAEFVPTDRNRQMYITYKFAGFREVERDGTKLVLENDYSNVQSFPPYITITSVDEAP
ncbi:HAD-IIIC family phosphatase [Pendulispora albinea]|uniref:HAD-IIIC family phosphatase n=1 Tax=Pendulispora albinea TaxID=2741071 RepID=A0ABZ2LQS9_9BACT